MENTIVNFGSILSLVPLTFFLDSINFGIVKLLSTIMNLNMFYELTGSYELPQYYHQSLPMVTQEDLGLYKSINNDYVRITFMTVALMTSTISIVTFYLGYEFATYFTMMANL